MYLQRFFFSESANESKLLWGAIPVRTSDWGGGPVITPNRFVGCLFCNNWARLLWLKALRTGPIVVAWWIISVRENRSKRPFMEMVACMLAWCCNLCELNIYLMTMMMMMMMTMTMIMTLLMLISSCHMYSHFHPVARMLSKWRAVLRVWLNCDTSGLFLAFFFGGLGRSFGGLMRNGIDVSSSICRENWWTK